MRTRSLEELAGGGLFCVSWSVSDDIGDPVVDGNSRVLQRLRVGFFRRVQLCAVTAVVTVADHADLVELGAVLPLRGPLPWVLTTVCEEDVRASSVESTLVDGRLVGLREVAHVQAVEDIGTHVGEVFLVNGGAAHGVLSAHRLEPAVLRAVLEGPGATRAHWVDLRARNDLPVVARGIAAVKLDESVSDVYLALTLQWLEHIAQVCALSVLDLAGHDVSIVREPVVGPEVGDGGLGKVLSDVVIGVTLVSNRTLGSHVLH